MRSSRRFALLGFAAALALPTAAPAVTLSADVDTVDAVVETVAAADAEAPVSASDNLRHVATLPYEERYGTTSSQGTDLEFATISVPTGEDEVKAQGKAVGLRARSAPTSEERTFAFAGSYRNGLQVVDVTDPENSEIVAVYDCAIAQGDVQVFAQGDRWLVSYTADVISSSTRTESRCYQDAGEAAQQARWGTFLVDVTDPYDPQTVSFMPVPRGSHNMTVHPSGDYLYNSNSDLITSTDPQIEIFDISNPEEPKAVEALELPFVPASLGSESHDLTFNADGSRAYSAALSQTVVIDTTDPTDPEVIGQVIDPTINVHHQSDPYTVTAEDGTERTFLLIEDEFVGALATGQCPNGGVHVYDITGEKERNPQKVGYWNIDEVRYAPGTGNLGPDPIGRCTAHVFRIYPEQGIMTIAFYNGGVRVVDLSGLAGVSLGETNVVDGMTEIGHMRFADSDTWAAKTPGFAEDGSFYLFGNDLNRGLDVYHFDAGAEQAQTRGTWLTAAEADALLPRVDLASLSADERTPICLLPVD